MKLRIKEQEINALKETIKYLVPQRESVLQFVQLPYLTIL